MYGTYTSRQWSLCPYSLEQSRETRVVCPFLQVKCFCGVIYCNRVQYDYRGMGGSLNQTHNRDDVTVVFRCCFFFHCTMQDGFGEQTNTCHIEAVTNSLEFYLSTPASHQDNSLQMFIKYGLSPRCIFNPVRLVMTLFVSITSTSTLCTWTWCWCWWKSPWNMPLPSGSTRRHWLISRYWNKWSGHCDTWREHKVRGCHCLQVYSYITQAWKEFSGSSLIQIHKYKHSVIQWPSPEGKAPHGQRWQAMKDGWSMTLGLWHTKSIQ